MDRGICLSSTFLLFMIMDRGRRRAVSPLNFVIFAIWILPITETARSTYIPQDNQYKCIALRFLNHAGGSFKVISTMKPEGYFINTDEYKLKIIFTRAQMRQFVIFHGADNEKKRQIFLDSERTMSVSPQSDCDHFVDVIVTAREGVPEQQQMTSSFSDANLPADFPKQPSQLILKTSPTTSAELSKSSSEKTEDAGERGKTSVVNKGQQYKKAEEKSTDVSNTFNPPMDFLNRPTGKYPALRSEMGETFPEQNDTTRQHDMLQHVRLKEHLFVTNDDDGTNLTYVDEDERGSERTSNYGQARDFMKSSDFNNEGKHGKGNGLRMFLKDGKKKVVSTNVRPRIEKHQRKVRAEEESNLLRMMWTLLSMYQSLKEGKRERNDIMKDVIEYVMPKNRKLEGSVSDNRIQAFPWRILKIKGLKNQKTVKVTPNDIMKIRTVPTISFSRDISQLKRPKGAPDETRIYTSKQAERIKHTKARDVKGKGYSRLVDMKGSRSKFMHHTSFIHKGSRLDIVNVLPENSTSSLSQTSSSSKPRFIHSKAEAIGEIVKALGNHYKIVKDANGLYLITGKHIKIIHRTQGPQSKKKHRTTLNAMSTVTSNTSSRLIFHNESQSLVPVLTIRTRNPLEISQEFSKNLLHDVGKKLGFPSSTYNLKDLEKNVRSKFSGTDMSKKKNQHNNSITLGNPGERKTPANSTIKPTNLDDVIMFQELEHMGRNELANIEQPIISKNGGHRSKMKSKKVVAGDQELGLHEAFVVSEKNHENATEAKSEVRNVYHIHHQSRSILAPIRNHSENFNSTFPKKEQFVEGLTLSSQNYVQGPSQKSLLKNGRDNSYPDASSDSTVTISRDKQDTHNYFKQNKIPNEVRVEVVDEEKPQDYIKESSNSAISARKDEDVEIIDEDKEAMAQSESPTIQDITSTLRAKFGEKNITSESLGIADKSSKNTTSSVTAGSLGIVGSPETTRYPGIPGLQGTTESLGKIGSLGSSVSQGTNESLRLAGPQGTTESPGTVEPPGFTGSPRITGSQGTSESPGKIGSQRTTESPEITVSQGTSESPGKIESQGTTESSGTTGSIGTTESPGITKSPRTIESVETNPSLGSSESLGVNQLTTAAAASDANVSTGENNLTHSTKTQESPLLDTSQNEGPLLTADIQNDLYSNKEAEQVANAQTVFQTSKNTAETVRNYHEETEPMVPMHIVDALLARIIKDPGERSIHKFKANDISDSKRLRSQTVKKYPSDNSPFKLSLGENLKSKERTKTGIKNQGLIEEVEEKVGFRNKFHESPKKALENSKLNDLLERFVNLLHRRLKKWDRTRKLKSTKTHPVFPATRPQTEDSKSLLKYQGKSLWRQQKRLEHQLAVEEEMLEKNQFSVPMYEKINDDTSIESERPKVGQTFGRKNEPILRKLKTKIRELNQEKNRLLKRLMMLKLKESKLSDDSLTVGDGDVSKITMADKGSSVTEVYDDVDKETGTAPYISSRMTYNDVKDERPDNEGTGEHSFTNLENGDTEHPLVDYEQTRNGPEQQPARDFEPKIHSNQVPQKELVNDRPFSVPRKLNDVGKPQDFLPYNPNDKFHYVEHPTTLEVGGETPQQIPTTRRPLDEVAVQISEPKYVTNPSSNVPGYPTPSFINKEANYVSNAADVFTHQNLNHETPHDMNYQEPVNGRSKTLSLAKSVYEQQPEVVSDSRDTTSRAQNVFPGAYSYGEDPTGREGIPRASEWRREDPLLMKEMPEYAPEDNTIESRSSTEHYAMDSLQKQSSVQIKSPVTTNAGSMDEQEEEKDGDQTEHKDKSEEFQKTTEDGTDSAFEVVDEGGVPTIRRKTDNPEDGVEDKPFINGNEYHLQKKHAIEKDKQKKIL